MVTACWDNGTYNVKFQDQTTHTGMSPGQLLKQEKFQEWMNKLPEDMRADKGIPFNEIPTGGS